MTTQIKKESKPEAKPAARATKPKVIRLDNDTLIKGIESILADSYRIGQDKSFQFKILFGQVPLNLRMSIGKTEILHEGIWIKDKDSASKVLESLSSVGSKVWYQLYGYLVARLLYGRQEISKTNVLLSKVIQSMESNGINKLDSLKVIQSDNSEVSIDLTTLSAVHKLNNDLYISLSEFYNEVGDNKGNKTRSVKSTPVYDNSDDNIII